jgi:type II secretory pathway component GspD/PulD (secretin)
LGRRANHVTDSATYNVDLPTLSKFETGTYATVPDGGSIIISGLATNIDGQGRPGTPVLMDLPIIGNVFSNRFSQKNKESYTCLVSAKIIIFE